ncbi:MAG TPA: FAD-binding oxidoreductase [Catenuloplanes sp.]|jgi:glycolate oxidase FAD binding subunit
MTGPTGDRAAVLRALLDICGPGFARVAGAADTVAGRQAGFVAAPGDPDAVVALLSLAAAKGHAVVPRGAGTKLDWGAAPSGVDLLLDTGRLAGVGRHLGDGSSVRVGAGTPVRAVQAILAGRGRRWAVDPPSGQATVGGVLAIDEAGPLRHRFGSPCDQLLAVRQVGYDGGVDEAAGPLVRDLCGRHGGAGVLLSATVQVEPLPEARLWVSRSVRSPLEVHHLVRAALDADLSPAAVEVDLPARTAAPRGRVPGSLAVLVEGPPRVVRERAAALVAVLGGDAAAAAAAPPWWGRYPFTAGEVAVRITVPIADLYAAVYALSDATGADVPVRGSAGVGVVHAALAGDTAPERVGEILDAVRGVLMARGGRCVVIAAPAALRAVVDLEGDAASD